jgi:uncharacterized membrane protein YkgB
MVEAERKDVRNAPCQNIPRSREETAMRIATLARIKPVAYILDRVDIQSLGGSVARYGLVAVVGWIGLMKFTHYEAEGIRPFVANSPLMSWAYSALGVDAFSALLGAVEVTIAALIALRPLSAPASALGSALAVGMFATTLSFLLTTPGVWEPSLGGFPAISAVPGQFLLKDIVLLGVALWSLGESLGRRRG